MFIAAVREHFPKEPEDEQLWIKSMASILRDFVPSELALAAEDILKKRQKRYFPLPVECLEACAHARQTLRIRAGVEAMPGTWPPPEKIMEPGREMAYRRDAAWRTKMHRKGITLRSDIEGRTDWWNWNSPSEATLQLLREKNRGR